MTAAPQRRVDGEALDFDEVYEGNVEFVWRSLAALGVARDRLEDAVQDVFVVVHAKLGEFEGRSKVTTWLYGIARNVALEHIRSAVRHRRRDGAAAEVPPDPPGTPDQAVERAAAQRLLLDVLATLDADRREVFVLVELEQIPVKEVAVMLGLKENTVWSRLRLARGEFDRSVARLRARDRGPR